MLARRKLRHPECFHRIESAVEAIALSVSITDLHLMLGFTRAKGISRAMWLSKTVLS